VAFVGKGGSGKSVIAGTMARMLARRGLKVLALDSDPIPGLSISLGLGPLTEPMLQDAAIKDPDGRWRLKKGIGPARAVQRYSVAAPDGVRLLQWGKATADGLAPVMGSLNAFMQVIHRLARERVLQGWTIVGDLPAGPRQAAFGWAPYASTYLIVVEPTWQSVLSGRRIARIARARNAPAVLAVANKVTHTSQVEAIAQRSGEQLIATVPADPAVVDADRHGAALLDHAPGSPAAGAIEALADVLERATSSREEKQ
jgi:CO dehydrogenase maturation factor